MVADAKENLAAESRKTPNTPETRMRLETDYKQLMQTIKDLAMEEYQLELHHERNQRRLSAGVPMTFGWAHYFREKQQNIIKQSSHRTDNSVRTASESPTEERRSTIVKPSNEPHALAPSVLPVPRNPSVFSHRQSPQPSPLYHNSSPHNDRPGFGGRETNSSHRDHSDEDDVTDDDDGTSKSMIKARRLRDLEVKKGRLKEYRKEADDELERTELEIRQLAGEETRKKDEEERRDEARWKEDARRREEEIGKKEAEIRRMEEEVKKKVEAAKRQEDEVMRKAEEFNRKEEEARQRAVQLEHETERMKRMQLAVQNFVEDLKRMKKEALKKDMKLKDRESILRRREAELILREADNFRREEDPEAKPKEAARLEEARKEEDNQLQAEEAERKEHSRREEARLEAFRREQEEKRQEAARKAKARPEEVRKEDDNRRQAEEARAKKDQQQAEFRRREEEIRRTREERKRNGNNRARSGSSRNLSVPPGASPGISRASQFNNGPFIRGRSPGLSTSRATGPTPTWGPSIRPTSACSFAVDRSANTSTETPTMGSVSSGTYSKSSSPHPTLSPPSLLKKPESDFRRTLQPRQLEPAGRPVFPKELQQVFEYHETLWSRLKTSNELSWDDLPWPMAKQPSNPDDITLLLIEAYIHSPLHPDKSRTPKDRIKDYIKRWHPDNFEAKLRKVVENDRGKVKLGAGNVARCLNDLLEKEKEEDSK
jgi:hypothetical protein